MDLTLNINEAKLALTEKPMRATSVERVMILNEIITLYPELPQPKRFARLLSLLLSRVSVPLEPHDLIVGRCVDRLLTPEEETVYDAFVREKGKLLRETLLHSGHCSYDWDSVVRLGLPGLRERASVSLAKQTDPEKRIFLESAIEIYDTLRDFMLRYADHATEKGMHAVAQNLREAATAAPKSFYAALQLLWIVALINCAYITPNPTLTVGRLDQILYPLYEADLRSGRLTREQAGDLITDYYCKHNLIMGRGEHQVGDATNSTTFSRIYNFDAPQYLLLAGTDGQGKDAVNDLTQLFAERVVPAFKNPVVVVRYFKGMNEAHPKLWQTLCKSSLQSASLMYYNDDNVLNTYQRIGIPLKDAREYVHFGCNWPGLGHGSAWMQMGPWSDKYHAYESEEERLALRSPRMRTKSPCGWPEDMMIVLRELAGREEQGITVEDVYSGFLARWASFVDEKLAMLELELRVRRRRPAAVLSYTDCFVPASLDAAACYSAGAKYQFAFQSFYMFGTVADMIITVDRLVFMEKRLTLRRLVEAADADFEGYPDVLALCRRVDKYGSDTAHSNGHAARLARAASDIVIEKSKPYLEKCGLFLEPCMQSDTWHLKMGMDYGATVDGRLAGTPFTQNSRPANGSCKNGITAMLNAMLHLPSDGVLSGALNLDIDKKDFEGERGLAVFGALLSTYLNSGGLHAQVSSLSREDLVDAQKNPHAHRDLRVRVTGYSGIFVDICEDLQNDIIERFG